MALRRLGLILFLAWLLLDFAAPTLPGVFFFEAPQLFMDTAVATSSAAQAATVTVSHQPLPAPRGRLDEDQPLSLRNAPAIRHPARLIRTS